MPENLTAGLADETAHHFSCGFGFKGSDISASRPRLSHTLNLNCDIVHFSSRVGYALYVRRDSCIPPLSLVDVAHEAILSRVCEPNA